ncbi:MAG: GntR family transcriptional regulator [Chloroflexota bacterium]|nr:GntR family transcriptional regulator [Chloroflexota bacterium]MDE3193639.1 GntR family transcriptional regulator [Chloroflexota bacterium]
MPARPRRASSKKTAPPRRTTPAAPAPQPSAASGQQRADYVHAKLREAIQSGRLRPGDRVREIELAAWLNVSRTPIRDALRRLESAGLVSHAPRQGLVVTQLDPQQVLELYALREVLEGAAAALAARYASESEVRSLQKLLATQKGTGNRAEELADLNRQFHEVLYHAARNRYLIQALGGLRDSLALLRDTTYSVPGRPAQALAEHTRIVDAIRRQNETAAQDAATKHIRSAANARLSMVIDIGQSARAVSARG